MIQIDMKKTHDRISKAIATAVVCLILSSSCSPVVSLRREVAMIPPSATGNSSHAGIVGQLEEAKRYPDPMVAAGRFIDAARSSYPSALTGDPVALSLYNHAVARLIETLEAQQAIPWSAHLEIGEGHAMRRLSARTEHAWRNGNRRLVVLDNLQFRGRYAGSQSIRNGIGAPIVAVVTADDHRKRFEAAASYVSLTAILQFDNDHSATLVMFDPLERKQIYLSGHYPVLAGNFTAAAGLALAETRIDRLGLARLFNVRKFPNDASLIRLQNYDPRRIPLVMIHGLQDTPATWMPMYQELLADTEIRENYQFWVFSYPSGLPYPHSAALLRHELDGIRNTFPDHKNLVLVGHSMGGIISRLMITDAGDRIWIEMFGKAPDELEIHGRSRQLLLDALVFSNRKEVDRAIFIATPHRGSVLASNWIGRMASRMIRLPSYVTDIRNDVASVLSADMAGLQLNFAPNSIDTLHPQNRFVREVNQIPVDRNTPFHSIIGDRGRGDTPDSSDGVVAYWSSHMEGASSEKIVPTGHGAHQHPKAIKEVMRILKLHLKQTR